MASSSTRRHPFIFALFFVFFFFSATAVFATEPEAEAPPTFDFACEGTTTVDTYFGPVKGQVCTEANIKAFKGIPYADAPVGQLRWADPVGPHPWAPSTLDATRFGSYCPQIPSLYSLLYGPSESEDCLFLNIFTPMDASPSKLYPVYFYIHGGSYLSYSGAFPVYWPQYIVNSTDHVVVTINYRLGALGGLADGSSDFKGNYGLKDQIAAIRFISQVIESFGGDHRNVQIAGESAGAYSVTAHLTIQSNAGYFNSISSQSNPLSVPVTKVDSIKQAGALKFAQLVGCTSVDITCLRAASVSSIIAAQADPYFKTDLKGLNGAIWGLVIDNQNIYEDPFFAITAGRVIPGVYTAMLGTVGNESNAFVYPQNPTPMSPAQYRAIVTAAYPTLPDLVSGIVDTYYPCAADSTDCRPQYAEAWTDVTFRCPTRQAAAAISGSNINTFLYNFLSYPSATSTSAPSSSSASICNPDSVCHGDDVMYFFHSAEFLPTKSFTQEESDFSLKLMGYLYNTTASNPNGWPKYDPKTDLSAGLMTPQFEVLEGFSAETCDFWAKFLPFRP